MMQEDVNNLGPVQRQPRLQDAELAHAVSLSLKVCSSLFNCSLHCYMLILINVNEFQTAEQEKALREQERNIGESSRGASNLVEVELGNLAATNGRYIPVLHLEVARKSYSVTQLCAICVLVLLVLKKIF